MPTARVAAVLILVAGLAGRAAAQSPADDQEDPTPQTLDAFRAAVARVLEETGVPGAGLALVRAHGIEWAGGVGLADRDAKTPVTADTHFRVGSLGNTFVAMALVQMYGDDLIDLDAPLKEVAPEVAFENPWEATAPVRVIDLLQHTAGFDDMHFTEMYNLRDPPDMPLIDVLAINPRSRHARWPPGTRMSYSNPGYGVAGYLVEKVAGMPYEDYIARKTFTPLGMTTSSFRLIAADDTRLARGYNDKSGPAVPFSPIYLRPAGNLHTSPRELAVFVQMLLGWGELGSAFVIDPEYLGNMERSRRTIASAAGLRNGYGSGIFHMLNLAYPMLGHDGHSDGFRSSYAYSPARDVGYVVLLNSTASPSAMTRIASLAVRYLKRDVEPPLKPRSQIPVEQLKRHEGYYHDASPRNHVFAGLSWLAAGRTIVVDGDTLFSDPVLGRRVPMVPVSDTRFRLEQDIDASRVFTNDASGTTVLTGMGLYAERRPRWRIEIVRVLVLASFVIALTPLVAFLAWSVRARREGRARPRFRSLKAVLFAVPFVLLIPQSGLSRTPMRFWGSLNWRTGLVFVGTLALPALALAIASLAVGARREGAGRGLITYALLVAASLTIITAYLSYWGLLGIRLWMY